MSYAIDFAPHVPIALLWVPGSAALFIVLYAFVVRARGAWARALVFAVAMLALANPLIVHETREPLSDVVALIADHSQSMDHRRGEEDAAIAQIKKKLAAQPNLVMREAEIPSRNDGEDSGTQAFAALNEALADVPQSRVAGAILVTDGEVHDAPPDNKPAMHAPLHALIVGQHNERDRKLTIISAARYAIVGKNAEITLRVDDFGAAESNLVDLDIRIDGADAGVRTLATGRNHTIEVPVAHGGENVVELGAAPGPAELTLQNNRAVVAISGVRDRLRVLLVSGEPHAGERVWRNLLKADPSVDLVHFTILRPPEKQDVTPINELSLIAFPTRQLFDEKLDQFDLVIFDRYRERGILPLAYFDNIARYVENGGALLVSSGPEFAEDESIYRTPLAAVLPAQPTGEIVAQAYKPIVTQAGLAHPVTDNLPGANIGNTPPTWGRWFRIIGAKTVSGETVMSGPGDRPLLVLDRIGKGRVAELLSDHAWLWARGYEGGGPQAELLRRLAHWLMKEPELEEERLSASIANGKIVIERRTMADNAKPVTMTTPSGNRTTVTLAKAEPGLWRATADARELGLYRLTDGTLNAVAAAGPLNPKEVADMRATDTILNGPARATGGSVHWLADGGVPDIRRVGAHARAFGQDWIGLRANHAYRVTAVEQETLLPPWFALLLFAGTLALAWRIEAR
ncbi:MAG TPA: hypothetical protein VK779_02305 [Rhizomicrobium sp.]|jgi:hypothetical protein|nr:hypothetical protein [Rhizomicrobium sp.]